MHKHAKFLAPESIFARANLPRSARGRWSMADARWRVCALWQPGSQNQHRNCVARNDAINTHRLRHDVINNIFLSRTCAESAVVSYFN